MNKLLVVVLALIALPGCLTFSTSQLVIPKPYFNYRVITSSFVCSLKMVDSTVIPFCLLYKKSQLLRRDP